jgi:hypothetical protein
MKNLAKLFFDIERVSFLLIVLPFFTFNLVAIFNSQFFNFINFSFLFFSLVFIDLLSKIILRNLNSYFFSIIFSTTVFVFFYGFYLTIFIQEIFFNNLGLLPRGRLILPLIFVGLISVNLIFRKLKYAKYLNLFLIIFTITNFSINLKEFYNSKLGLTQLDSNFHQIHLTDNLKKPVLLIIMDEYSSPNEFFKFDNDSSVFNFSEYLQRNNWQVRNSSNSFEKSTIHSISSLFNFNLSKDSIYSGMDIYDLGSEKLIKSSLYDSLNSKGVDFINFGIFRVGNSNPSTLLYKYPENFLDVFLFNTVFNHVIFNTGGFKMDGFGKDFFPMEGHNKFIFNSASDSLNKFSNTNFFSYIHLYMPHSPFLFEEEFDEPLKNDTYGYFKYWKFTNEKLELLLNELIISNKYRIILSGDHGFRGDSRINPNNTFTAFYGFSEEDLTTINSVQDLGILIYACY